MKIKLDLPHEGQLRVISEARRFNVLECGRRFGKTTLGLQLCFENALQGFPVAWFAPTYKTMAEQWKDAGRILRDAITQANKVEQQMRLMGGGLIDFWSLDNSDSGRGRKYKRVVIDEASIIRDLQTAWQHTIRPTLTDLRGDAWFLGTPKGRNFFHQMFAKGQSDDPEWKSWRMGTTTNPYMPKDEIDGAKRELPEQVFNQEYMGIPADDGGNPFGMTAIQACAIPSRSKEPAVAYGVDLAKSSDWTWVIGLDAEGRECVSERWQGDWGATRRRVSLIVGDAPTLIDSTGVGDPIVEDLQRTNPNVESYKFTALSKQQLMEGLASAIQQRMIGIADEQLIRELEVFEYEYTRTGVRYTAPAGMHDDGVCALALATRLAGGFGESALVLAGSLVTPNRINDEERYWSIER